MAKLADHRLSLLHVQLHFVLYKLSDNGNLFLKLSDRNTVPLQLGTFCHQYFCFISVGVVVTAYAAVLKLLYNWLQPIFERDFEHLSH